MRAGNYRSSGCWTIYSVKATRGPVQAGEELILPNDEELLLEVKVPNRDIGFIREGMKGTKWRLFRFKNLALLMGVVKVSPNAIVDKELA